jgi:NTP pyrophosphatase (non-canonical NTP hydrolase)
MSWEYAHYETAWAVHLHAGDDELPTPAAVFRRKEDAEEYIGRERQKALLDDYDGDAAAAKARGAKAADYLHDAGVFEVRNCYVPWWNSMGDVDHDPGPLPDYELAELVRLNAPEAGEDTLAAVERRLAEWHLRKYGPAPVDLARTVAKLGEEFGELCRAFLRGGKAIGREAADMVFVLFHLVRGCGYSLTAAVNEKIPVIERRLTDPSAGRELATPAGEVEGVVAERDALLAFKAYVHRRLDEAGVAADPHCRQLRRRRRGIRPASPGPSAGRWTSPSTTTRPRSRCTGEPPADAAPHRGRVWKRTRGR